MFRKSSRLVQMSLTVLFSLFPTLIETQAGTSGNILHFPEKMDFSVTSNLHYVFDKDMLEAVVICPRGHDRHVVRERNGVERRRATAPRAFRQVTGEV